MAKNIEITIKILILALASGMLTSLAFARNLIQPFFQNIKLKFGKTYIYLINLDL
jgi:hypothetical protein